MILVTSVGEFPDGFPFVIAANKLLKSLLRFGPSPFDGHYCLYDESLSEKGKQTLLKGGWILVENHPDENLYLGTKFFSSTWQRAYIPRIFDNDYALYMDPDMFFIAEPDFSNWPTLIGDSPVGMALETLGGQMLNAGLILFNMKKCRELNLTDEWLKVALHNVKINIKTQDQNTLNIIARRFGYWQIQHNYNTTPHHPVSDVIVYHFRGPKPWPTHRDNMFPDFAYKGNFKLACQLWEEL